MFQQFACKWHYAYYGGTVCMYPGCSASPMNSGNCLVRLIDSPTASLFTVQVAPGNIFHLRTPGVFSFAAVYGRYSVPGFQCFPAWMMGIVLTNCSTTGCLQCRWYCGIFWKYQLCFCSQQFVKLLWCRGLSMQDLVLPWWKCKCDHCRCSDYHWVTRGRRMEIDFCYLLPAYD